MWASTFPYLIFNFFARWQSTALTQSLSFSLAPSCIQLTAKIIHKIFLQVEQIFIVLWRGFASVKVENFQLKDVNFVLWFCILYGCGEKMSGTSFCNDFDVWKFALSCLWRQISQSDKIIQNNKLAVQKQFFARCTTNFPSYLASENRTSLCFFSKWVKFVGLNIINLISPKFWFKASSLVQSDLIHIISIKNCLARKWNLLFDRLI